MSERRYGERDFLGSERTPFSKGLMARVLTAIGVPEEHSYELARRSQADLAQRGETSLELGRLQELAADLIGEPAAARAVRRVRRYRAVPE